MIFPIKEVNVSKKRKRKKLADDYQKRGGKFDKPSAGSMQSKSVPETSHENFFLQNKNEYFSRELVVLKAG